MLKCGTRAKLDLKRAEAKVFQAGLFGQRGFAMSVEAII
jgi:hypothetical protein